MTPKKHLLHPLAALQFLQQSLFVLLAPFLRVLFAWQIDALWRAVQQDIVLFCLLCTYTFFAWRKSYWRGFSLPCTAQGQGETAPQKEGIAQLFLQRGLLLQTREYVLPAQLAAICIERTFWLRLVGARRLILYPKTPADGHGQTSLLLPKADAWMLADALMPTPRDGAAVQHLHASRYAQCCMALLGNNFFANTFFLRNFLATAAHHCWYCPQRDLLAYQSGIFLHHAQYRIRGEAILYYRFAKTPLARLLKRQPVTLVAGGFDGTHHAVPLGLYHTRKNAQNAPLFDTLPHFFAPEPPPKEPLRGRSLFAFFWQSGGLFLLCALGWGASVWLDHTLQRPFALGLLASVCLALVSAEGFCTEGIWVQGGQIQLCMQQLYRMDTICFAQNAPVFCATQSPFARFAGRIQLTLSPHKSAKLRIRSVLLKNLHLL